ncbi:MAG: methyltransferase domain-containing protein [Polyangiaceae bacterium]|nr:methyltransferase domain-containing protein [Polyangiaceae bacterium]
MSDRPPKLSTPPPLLGEDMIDDEPMIVPLPPRPAVSGPKKDIPTLSVPRPSQPELTATTRKRTSSPSLSASAVERADPVMAPLKPMPIITVGPMVVPNERSSAEAHESTAQQDALRPASGIDVTHDEGWTPYAPPVVEAVADAKPPTPAPKPAPRPSQASQDDIPIDVETEEEISIDDSERITDPNDIHEVVVEELVSVEEVAEPPPKPPPVGPPSNRAMAAVVPPVSVSATPPAIPAPPAVASAAPSSPPLAVAPPAQEPDRVPRVPLPSSSTVSTPPAGTPGAFAASAGTSGTSLFMPSGGTLAIAPPPMSEAAANRNKKIRPWWEDLFNDDFIRTMAKITDQAILREVDFIEESLGCEAGATILDLACGTGRHAVELAARGYQVVGFDLSLAMLARASDEAQERKQKINFVQGDMREISFDEAFDGIYTWNTSFGYFDEEKNNAVIAKVHKALKKGGQFLLDVVNRDYVIRQTPSTAWFEGDGCICMDEMQIDFITSRMKIKRTLMMEDARAREIEYSIRIYSLHELGKMLHDNGFRVAEVSGSVNTPGVFFGCEAPRTLILAEKR